MVTLRQGLLAAFAALILFVSISLLATSLGETSHLAAEVSEARVDATVREARQHLAGLFEPIRTRIESDCAALRLHTLDTRDVASLKDLLIPDIAPLASVGSAMFGDPDGRQVLVMRYDEAVRDSPLLGSLAIDLPQPQPDGAQFFTREVRPQEWGDRSVWTLWDAAGRNPVLGWEIAMPGYDPRNRPWHELATRLLAEMPPASPEQFVQTPVGWTEVYSLFTTKTPGISATAAMRTPDGRVDIIAYDLLLDDISAITSSLSPTPHAEVFVMTQDGRLLGAPRAPSGEARPARLDAIENAGFAEVADAVAQWRQTLSGQPGRTRIRIGGEPWWAGFQRYAISDQRWLWIGVLLPESDLLPAGVDFKTRIIYMALAALAVAALLSWFMSRRFSGRLAALAHQSSRIANLELRETPPVTSRIRELNVLGHALAHMRSRLRERVAERDRARQESMEREAQLRTLTENTPDSILRCDRDLRIQFCNREKCELLASTEGSGDHDEPPAIRGELSEAIQQVLTSSTPARIEFSPTDQSHTFEVRIFPECDSSGAIVTALCLSRDMTEINRARAREKALEERLRNSQKLEAVGLLAAGVAHDFNNVLQVIETSASIAMDPAQTLDQSRDCLQGIRHSVKHAAALTRQLLAFSQRQPLQREDADLREIIADLTSLLTRTFPKSIEITTKLGDEPVLAHVDRNQIEQVLMNLAVNARDAMPAGGKISIELRVETHNADARLSPGGTQPIPHARIRVSDTGVGIRAEDRERIFDPFFTTKKRAEGTGLGLSVAYGIVEQHHGRLEVSSEAGIGTTFSVILPLATGKTAPAQPVAPTAPPKAPTSATVLLAEDSAQVRRLARMVLERQGYVVVEAADGLAALERFRQSPERFDLLFFDVMMPGLDGFESVERCRAIRPDVRVLFASGYAAESIEQLQERPAGSTVLSKPYSVDGLTQAIANALDAPPAQT